MICLYLLLTRLRTTNQLLTNQVAHAFNPQTGNGGNLPPGLLLQNFTNLSAECYSYFLLHYHWIIWASEARDCIIISASGFSLQLYKMNFCRSENRFYRCRREWLWHTHATLTNVMALDVIRLRGVYRSVWQQCSSILNMADTNRK